MAAAGSASIWTANCMLAKTQITTWWLWTKPSSSSSRMSQLRYFAGLTIEEAAQALDISVRTANRHWAYARAWLYQQLS
jgi:hypothetical protein